MQSISSALFETTTLEGLKAHIFLILILASGITASIRNKFRCYAGHFYHAFAWSPRHSLLAAQSSVVHVQHNILAAQCSKSTKLRPVLLRTAATPVRHHTHYVKYGVLHCISKHHSKVNCIKLLEKTVLKYQRKVERKGHNMHVKATFTLALAGGVQWVQRI